MLIGNKQVNDLRGRGGSDLLHGARGGDIVRGGAGRDELFGGRGTDTLRGGQGRDTLDGGSGADNIFGGAGADLFVFDPGFRRATLSDFEDGADTLQIGGWGTARTFSDLDLSRSDAGTLIGVAGDGIFIEAIAPRHITAADFDFV